MKKSSLVLLLSFFIWSACTTTETKTQGKKIVQKDFSKTIDSCKQFLQNGTIVLRTGNDAISDLFAQLNKTNKTFSHCGIAFKEDSTWYVYHSIGGEDNPDEKLRKEKFEHFIAENHNIGFGICQYSINENETNNLQKIVQQWYQQHIPFDMQFDLKTNDRLYCAEMVYKAYNKACNSDSFFTITNHKGFQYVSTDNIFVNKDAKLLCHIVY